MREDETRPIRGQAEDHGMKAQPNHLFADCARDLIGRSGALQRLSGRAEGQQQALRAAYFSLGAAERFRRSLHLAVMESDPAKEGEVEYRKEQNDQQRGIEECFKPYRIGRQQRQEQRHQHLDDTY